MIKYSNEQLATIIALPTVTALLVWTVAIFHKNRKKWGPYDIPIVSVLVLSIIRNLTILTYLLIATLTDKETLDFDYCSVVVWVFNSLHTFQASSLTTIAVIGLFSVKLHRKQQSLKQFLTPTHIVYHLFCLTTLCACVGVAAILAQNDREGTFENIASVFEMSACKFMPFDLDVKYNVFIVVLHMFLAVISLFSFIIICYYFYKTKRYGFDFSKSNSDLSDMSLGLTNTLNVNVVENKGFYDTYTIHRVKHPGDSGSFYETNGHVSNGFCAARDVNWNSDLSNISTTVSSTNSRRPCLGQNLKEREDCDKGRIGLETIHPVLIVCYLFYHLPLIILCIYPKLIHPWPVAGIALWLGLVQDVLIPIGLGIVDTRFCKWVSSVYKCSGKRVEEKLPHVGLDGKFRPFGSTGQPQSLEISNQDRNVRAFQPVEHRFPITNGSLYTSIDGRLPVIHNYRRNKDQRPGVKPQENLSSNVALHSSHLSRVEFVDNPAKFASCTSCEADQCPSHSNLHHLSPQYINKQLNLLQQTRNAPPPPPKVTQSHDSLNYMSDVHGKQLYGNFSDANLCGNANNYVMKSSRNLVRLNRMRLSRSEDSLTELQREFGNYQRPPANKKTAADKNGPQMKNYRTTVNVNVQNGYSSSDDDYLTDNNDVTNTTANDAFDSLSSKSGYSITTEANCDFEFFQSRERLSINVPVIDTNNEVRNNKDGYCALDNPPSNELIGSRGGSQNELNKNFRITRSNSKRSLESFRAFVENEDADVRNNNVSNKSTLQRSNSYMTLEDRQNRKQLLDQFGNRQKMNKSIEYLPNSTASTVFIEDFTRYGQYLGEKGGKCAGSAPDLKKVFISEYI